MTARLLSRLTTARAANNVLWMDLVWIALAAAPKETRAVLRQIAAKDRQIKRAFERLAK